MKRAVHFGAGSIGRGLVGERLYASNYQTTFVDIDKDIIKQINEKNEYDLYLINHDLKKMTIKNVKALSLVNDVENIIEEISKCDLITTSVWPENLPKIASVIAQGLELRWKTRNSLVEILACENAIFASRTLKEEVMKVWNLEKKDLKDVAKFVNTAIARMVINDQVGEEKVVNIADEFEITIAKNELIDSTVEPIVGGFYTNNLNKYIERKLFIVNSSHCIGSYLGDLQNKAYVRDCFTDKKILEDVLLAMKEAALLVSFKHDFLITDLEKFIQKTINRYVTPGVKDPLERVCRNPIKKVGPRERLVLPIIECEEHNLPNEGLCKGLAAAYLYDNPKDEQSIELQSFIKKNGIRNAIKKYSVLDENEKLINNVVKYYENMKRGNE